MSDIEFLHAISWYLIDNPVNSNYIQRHMKLKQEIDKRLKEIKDDNN